jgi:phosphorylcholine metabolism protein LicD
MGKRELKIFSDEELAQRNKGLQEIKKVLDELGVKFLLIDGVLLGAVREKNFIKWDWDVELGLYTEEMEGKIDEIVEAMGRAGLRVGTVVKDKDNLKVNVHKYNTKYSLIGYFVEGDYRRRRNWQVPAESFSQTEEIDFLGAKYRCPSPPEAYLEFTYGDWKTPKQETDPDKYLTKEIKVKKSLVKKILECWKR